MRRRSALAALVVIVLAWNAALLAAPAGKRPRLAGITYLAGALVCHQQPERSFHRGGAQYPVCARCLGLYLGAVIGVLGWVMFAGLRVSPSRRGRRIVQDTRLIRRALIVAAVPTITTVALAWAGIWDGSNAVRAWLAVPLGAVITASIAAVAAGDLR